MLKGGLKQKLWASFVNDWMTEKVIIELNSISGVR